MSSDAAELTMSQLSLHSNGSQGEDWDRSMSEDSQAGGADPPHTPRNSVAFPGDGATPGQHEGPVAAAGAAASGKRTLSQLLKLYAEEGNQATLSTEEANRVAEVLGRWINSESSPYEGEDDFFRTQDDSALPLKRAGTPGTGTDAQGRPRGQSESVVSS